MENKEKNNSEDIKLGEQIILSGFQGLDGGSMVILRKMIGNEVRKISDWCEQFEQIRLVLKKTHQTEASEVYEINGNLTDKGKHFNTKVEERNLFLAVSKTLEKLQHELEHARHA